MKLLLTSAGIKNPSIHAALVDMLGKPIAASNALCITTASYGHPMAGPVRAWNFISGQESQTPMCELGWKSVGVLEPALLPSLDRALWLPWLEQADAILVNGGDTSFLAYWLRQSGLTELLPTLDLVWVGLSAGSMVMTPDIGADFVSWKSPTGGDEPLGLVDFSIYPHLDHPLLPSNTLPNAERWAATLSNAAYAIDDDTAFKVIDHHIDVISEGTWKLLRP